MTSDMNHDMMSTTSMDSTMDTTTTGDAVTYQTAVPTSADGVTYQTIVPASTTSNPIYTIAVGEPNPNGSAVSSLLCLLNGSSSGGSTGGMFNLPILSGGGSGGSTGGTFNLPILSGSGSGGSNGGTFNLPILSGSGSGGSNGGTFNLPILSGGSSGGSNGGTFNLPILSGGGSGGSTGGTFNLPILSGSGSGGSTGGSSGGTTTVPTTQPLVTQYYNGVNTLESYLDSVPGGNPGGPSDPSSQILGAVNQAPSPLKEIGGAFVTPIVTLGHSGSVFTPVNTVQNIYDLWFHGATPSGSSSVLNPPHDLVSAIMNQMGLGVVSGIGDSTKAGLASAQFATTLGNVMIQAASPLSNALAQTPVHELTHIVTNPVVAESGQLVATGIDLNQGVLKNYANAKETVMILPRSVQDQNIPVLSNVGAVGVTAASYVLTEPQFVVEHYSMEINKTTNLVNAAVVGSNHLIHDTTTGHSDQIIPDLMKTAHTMNETMVSFDLHHMYHDMPFTTGIVPTAAALSHNVADTLGTPALPIVPDEISNKTVELVNNLHFSILQPGLSLSGQMTSGMTGGESWPITNIPATTTIPDGDYERGHTSAPSVIPSQNAAILNNLFGQVSGTVVYQPAAVNASYPHMPMSASAPNYYNSDYTPPGHYH